jgi:hypothetical protein
MSGHLAREGFFEVKASQDNAWIRITGATGIDDSDAKNIIPCSNLSTRGQVPYKTDLSEVIFEFSLNTLMDDLGQRRLRQAYTNGTNLQYRYAEVENPGSDYEMQIGTLTVESFNRSSSDGELATRSVSCRAFGITYTDQSGLTA